MLTSLFIQNFVLIDHLDMQFGKGLSVVTGETGAGKSIILGALSLVLGQRADSRSIKKDAERCVIEATFDISAYQLEPFFEENGLEFEPHACLFRRELYASSGKSRAFVNDSPVSLPVMKELGARLIDIHSQHQNLLLSDNRFQLNVVDVMARNGALLADYRNTYMLYQSQRKELKDLQDKADQIRQEEEYMRFRLTQLEEAKLTRGEQEELEQEREILAHVQDIKGGLYRITELLSGEEQRTVATIKEALAVSTALERHYPQAQEMSERLRTAYIDLKDLASETDRLQEDVEFHPDRLEWINDRLDTIYSLQQKYQVLSVGELIVMKEEYAEQLDKIGLFDDRIVALTGQAEQTFERLLGQASELSRQRKEAADGMIEKLTGMVAQLSIPNARLKVEVISRSEPGADGMDDVCFLFSANKNEALQPVAQTASGGEISRLMLCIKAMIAGFTALPAVIFDEVDTGISGDTADKMGDIMQQLGTRMQVITITHLPQIASKGTAHYLVYKEDSAESTVTRVKQLTENERITEVARMLSGAVLTEASIANARELLRQNNRG